MVVVPVFCNDLHRCGLVGHELPAAAAGHHIHHDAALALEIEFPMADPRGCRSGFADSYDHTFYSGELH